MTLMEETEQLGQELLELDIVLLHEALDPNAINLEELCRA
jgi:hypothetical protein